MSIIWITKFLPRDTRKNLISGCHLLRTLVPPFSREGHLGPQHTRRSPEGDAFAEGGEHCCWMEGGAEGVSTRLCVEGAPTEHPRGTRAWSRGLRRCSVGRGSPPTEAGERVPVMAARMGVRVTLPQHPQSRKGTMRKEGDSLLGER